MKSHYIFQSAFNNIFTFPHVKYLQVYKTIQEYNKMILEKLMFWFWLTWREQS